MRSLATQMSRSPSGLNGSLCRSGPGRALQLAAVSTWQTPAWQPPVRPEATPPTVAEAEPGEGLELAGEVDQADDGTGDPGAAEAIGAEAVPQVVADAWWSTPGDGADAAEAEPEPAEPPMPTMAQLDELSAELDEIDAALALMDAEGPLARPAANPAR